jgi:hypothetical protein
LEADVRTLLVIFKLLIKNKNYRPMFASGFDSYVSSVSFFCGLSTCVTLASFLHLSVIPEWSSSLVKWYDVMVSITIWRTCTKYFYCVKIIAPVVSKNSMIVLDKLVHTCTMCPCLGIWTKNPWHAMW